MEEKEGDERIEAVRKGRKMGGEARKREDIRLKERLREGGEKGEG